MPDAISKKVEGSGIGGGLWRLWRQRPSTFSSPARHSPEGIGTPTGTYRKKNPPAKNLGATGSPPGKSGWASTGRMNKDGMGPISATGRSRISASGSSLETSGLAFSEI